MCPTRKPKGKLVALLAGAVVVVLVAVSWKNIYCHLFLDPQLVGRWRREVPGDRGGHAIEFDRIGNFQNDRGARSRYRIDGKALVIMPEGDDEASRSVKFYAYRVKGVSLALASSDGVEMFRRIPDE